MAPKPRDMEMEMDDVIWERNEKKVEEWQDSIQRSKMRNAIADFIWNFTAKYKSGKAAFFHKTLRGGYNIIYRLEYEDGSSIVMRIPSKGDVRSPDEKVRYEVATMRYVAAHTTIPVPKVYFHGTAAENPLGPAVPFIIMDYVEHEMTLYDALKDSTLPADTHRLDPNTSEEKLELVYGQMANILLQLSKLPPFPRIGSLVENENENEDGDEDGRFSVVGRPLIQNMYTLLDNVEMPPGILPPPSKTYATSSEWFAALADMHLAQLALQHNDAVDDEDDCRDKYVARQLFRQLASSGRLTTTTTTTTTTTGYTDNDNDKTAETTSLLYSADLTPHNVLVDKDLRVAGVVDWEFAYAAPAQFSSDGPWWLLLAQPHKWPGGYEAWMRAYEPRLETFLRVLEREEEEEMLMVTKTTAQQAGSGIDGRLAGLSLSDNDSMSRSRATTTTTTTTGTYTTPASSVTPLSQRMRESWERKTWMVNYAARQSWQFDFVFWRYLDERYFGPANEDQDHRARLALLSAEQLGAMEPFVERKMRESRDRVLFCWDHDGVILGRVPYLVL